MFGQIYAEQITITDNKFCNLILFDNIEDRTKTNQAFSFKNI